MGEPRIHVTGDGEQLHVSEQGNSMTPCKLERVRLKEEKPSAAAGRNKTV